MLPCLFEIFAIVLISYSTVSAYHGKVVCYFASWSVSRSGNGKFDIGDIDPNLCSHLNYAFVGINEDGTIKTDQWNDIDNGGFRKFNDLKRQNPNLKTLVAIGGGSDGSATFSRVANSPSLRSNLIQNAVKLIRDHGFNGFDIDWEYPVYRGGQPHDKGNFVQLLKEFRSEFDRHGYLLSVAVAATADMADSSYDVPQISRYVHYINLMTYDLHGSWDSITGHNAPLYASAFDRTDYQKMLNADACVKAWLNRGADPKKIILGLPTYGRTFTLANPGDNGLGAPASGGGNPGPYTRESGILCYNEICEQFKAGGWNRRWINEQQVPYAIKDDQWVGYDDASSIRIKVKYAIDKGLGGVMVWTVDFDDFRGICGSRYPLLNAIKNQN